MAHTHEPAPADRATYYLDQLFTIAVCGALAGVTITLWQSNLLGRMLHPKFHIWVLTGGLGLLALVVIRAVAVWRSIDALSAPAAPALPPVHEDHGHGHSHSHGGEPCGHAHGAEAGIKTAGGAFALNLAPPAPAAQPAHSHSHSHGQAHGGHGHSHGGDDGHDHGWAPWRYVVLLLPVVLYFLILSNPAFDREPVSNPQSPLDHIQNFITIFRSILWEAMPFIVLGALIAGLLEELLPPQAIARVLPRSPALAILMGGLLGLVFPMCECGIIPIMRRLLRKGLPLSCCVAYLLAGPIVNVVVLMSTWFAFSGMENAFEGGKPSYQMGGMWMVGFRAGLGYLVAVVTGFIVHLVHTRYGNDLLTPLARPDTSGPDEEDRAKRTFGERLSNVSETALHDFIDITVFLILGALLAAGSRLVLTPDMVGELSRSHALVAIALMMAFAVLLCLCSEADAFVAASFVTLRPSAKLAFLTLGPMMDFKLFFMYTRVFRPRLIWTIIASVVVQVFVYSAIVHVVWEANAHRWVEPKQPEMPPIPEGAKVRYGAITLMTAPTLLADPVSAGLTNAIAVAGAAVAENTGDAQEMTFLQLEMAALSPDSRHFYEDKWIKVVARYSSTEGNMAGRNVGKFEQVFTLVRYRIQCCGADATPIKALILVDPAIRSQLPLAEARNNWVELRGKVQFQQNPRGEYVPCLILEESPRFPVKDLITIIPPPPNPYLT